MSASRPFVLALALFAGGCANRPAPVAIAAAPVPAPPPAPEYAPNLVGVVAPPRLPDGSFATPNRTVSAGGALWHLRAGLNVAALGCPGSEIAAGYNALLATHRVELAATYRAVSAEHGGDFDPAMTRLYNYYALPPAQPALCRAAVAVLADAALIAPGGLGAFAQDALPQLDAPFVALFEAKTAGAAQRFALRAPVAANFTAALGPQLSLDHSVFRQP